MATVPNMTMKNMNITNTSNMVGKEFKSDCTSFLILGIELIVLRGLKIRITLIADTLLAVTT